jgi:integrase
MAHKGTNQLASGAMGRPLTGRLEAQPLKDGRTAWVARFRAYGQPRKLTIGHNPPWPESRAREELENIIYQVRRGVWVPPENTPTLPLPGIAAPRLNIAQLAHAYLEHRRTLGKGSKGGQQQELLEQHVVPDWGSRLPEDATPENVRRWVTAKVDHAAELRSLWDLGVRLDSRGRRLPRPYGARRLNRAINALYAVLDYAHVFHDAPQMTDRLRQSGLLLEEPAPVKAHFTIDQVALIIEAAVTLDARAFPGHKHVGRQALVATLLLSGLRIDEACSLLVGGVRRGEHILNIPDAKTPTGIREVNVVYGLRPILYAHLDDFRSGAAGSSPVFATRNDTAQSPNNMREDVWYGALKVAQELAGERGLTDNWPAKLNPHLTRRTFITHLFEIGESPPYVQKQVGHADSALTLEVYADVSSRRGPVPKLSHELYGTDRTRRVDA